MRDSNQNTPQFQDVDSYKFSVLETIGDLMREGSEVSATDQDRCWYGNGRVKFRSTDNNFEVGGGDEIPAEPSNICKANPLDSSSSEKCVADISVRKESGPGQDQNGLDKEQDDFYYLTIVAHDNPQTESELSVNGTNET